MPVFYHNGAMGDIIYSLPSVIVLGGGDFYIRKKDQYDFINSLISIQPCVTSVSNGKPKRVEFFDLCRYRKISDANLDLHLAKCHLSAFELGFDLSKKWLFNVDEKKEAKIAVSVTPKYHDKKEIDWSELSCYKDDMVFIGLDRDLAYFTRTARFVPKRYVCGDALEMASVIKGSNIFLGNQSLGFALAEAMKHPRVLEVCYGKNNCQPHGENGYTYLNETILQGL